MTEDTPKYRPMKRDREILQHVARYRLTTREIVQSLFMPDTDVNAVTKVLGRLVGARLLSRHTLHDVHQYWTLGVAGAHRLGLNEKRASALGYSALVEHYGVLLFCCQPGKPRRELLTPGEFEAQFPGHGHPSIQRAAYYVDEHKGVRRLGMIIVDRNGDPLRLIRKCMGELRRRRELIPAFLSRLRNRDVVCAVVTGDAERGQVLEQLWAKQEQKSAWFRATVREGLAPLWVNYAYRR